MRKYYILRDDRKNLEDNFTLLGIYDTLEEAYNSGHALYWEIETLYNYEEKQMKFVEAKYINEENKRLYIYPEAMAKTFL